MIGRALPIAVDEYSHTVSVGGIAIHTTPSEYEIVAFMAARRGRLISRDTLADVLYGARPDCDGPQSNVVAVMICNIRRKLHVAGATPLQRRWGIGYIMPAAPPDRLPRLSPRAPQSRQTANNGLQRRSAVPPPASRSESREGVALPGR